MKTNLRYLFGRFLEKECTQEELQELFGCFGTEDEGVLRELITEELEQEKLRELMPDPAKLRELYAGITARIQEKKARRYRALKIAASLFVGLLLAGGYFYSRQASGRLASVKEIHLPDGSVAWLDAGTVLSYPDHFNGAVREVTLTGGAAFFDIVHKAQPFIVKTNTALVTVLGTSFEVSAFKDSTTQVSVKTGRVGVQLLNQKEPARLLSPGQATIATPTGLALTYEPVADIAAWREQKLIFNDQPLGEVLESLERKYKVQIAIQNQELLTEKVTMRLDNPPLKDILTAISFANHFNYEINGQLIVVK